MESAANSASGSGTSSGTSNGRVRDRILLLRRSIHGDADLVLTFLGERLGKITAFGRAARRSKKRFGGALSWFTISAAELSRRPGSEMYTLASADVVRAHAELAIDPKTLSHASYATELTRELIGAENPETGVFALLEAFYELLRRRGASRFALRAFELALLSELGLAPSFDACARCGDTDLERGAVLDAHGGGVACAACAARLRSLGTRQLSDSVRALLAAAAAISDFGDSTAFSDNGAAGLGSDCSLDDERDAQRAMSAILSRYLSAPLRSLEFIAKMNAASA